MPKGAEVNLRTLCWYWGAAERGRGVQQHATYLILPESFTANTGSFQGMPRRVGSREGRPQRNADVLGSGGRGVVVRRRESHLRDGQEEQKKTPKAKAPSFRKLRMPR
jgi:hypothetical protein